MLLFAVHFGRARKGYFVTFYFSAFDGSGDFFRRGARRGESDRTRFDACDGNFEREGETRRHRAYPSQRLMELVVVVVGGGKFDAALLVFSRDGTRIVERGTVVNAVDFEVRGGGRRDGLFSVTCGGDEERVSVHAFEVASRIVFCIRDIEFARDEIAFAGGFEGGCADGYVAVAKPFNRDDVFPLIGAVVYVVNVLLVGIPNVLELTLRGRVVARYERYRKHSDEHN